MNLEQMTEISRDLKDDFSNTKVVRNLNQLISTLSSVISGPNTQNQEELVKRKDTFLSALRNSKVNKYPPSWMRTLVELGIFDLLGDNLATRVDAIFSRNQVTLPVVLKELEAIKAKLEQLDVILAKYIEASEFFAIASTKLSPGEYEVIVSIPRPAIDNEVKQLGKEFTQLDRIFGVFSEIATGRREPFKIRSLSSSDPTISIETISQVAALIAVAIERTVALYEKVLNIRKLHHELKKFEIPTDLTDQLSNHIDKQVSVGIAEQIEHIRLVYLESVEEGRRNELLVEVNNALTDLADRVDAGYTFDVRGEPPTQAKEVDGADGKLEIQKARELHESIERSRANFRYFKATGERILSLPQTKESEK